MENHWTGWLPIAASRVKHILTALHSDPGKAPWYQTGQMKGNGLESVHIKIEM